MKILDRIEEGICILCLIAMTALVFANVFSRYVLHLSLSFSEEITTNLFVLLSMMGTAIAARRRAHLGLSILTDAVSPKVRRALMIFGFSLSTIFCFAVFFYGIKMVRNEYILGQVTPSMQWPEWIYGCFVPFGAAFMTLRFAQITLEEIRTPSDQVKTDAELIIEEAAEEEKAYLAKEDETK
ncbi:MAG: TRAP transporter small permease [Spirochaetales bacterium]|nr:TRAP transporter small permease [Spirochaetales bacterium]